VRKVRQKMELIIKLADDIAKGIRGENECEVEPREIVRSFQATIADAIKNGTPLPKGEWISRRDADGNINDYCSECGTKAQIGYVEFCGKCGADMRGEEE